ncbi:hypothetical protein D3C84_1080270 [compost metagenome]
MLGGRGEMRIAGFFMVLRQWLQAGVTAEMVNQHRLCDLPEVGVGLGQRLGGPGQCETQ